MAAGHRVEAVCTCAHALHYVSSKQGNTSFGLQIPLIGSGGAWAATVSMI
jgi:hypothetical protein